MYICSSLDLFEFQQDKFVLKENGFLINMSIVLFLIFIFSLSLGFLVSFGTNKFVDYNVGIDIMYKSKQKLQAVIASKFQDIGFLSFLLILLIVVGAVFIFLVEILLLLFVFLPIGSGFATGVNILDNKNELHSTSKGFRMLSKILLLVFLVCVDIFLVVRTIEGYSIDVFFASIGSYMIMLGLNFTYEMYIDNSNISILLGSLISLGVIFGFSWFARISLQLMKKYQSIYLESYNKKEKIDAYVSECIKKSKNYVANNLLKLENTEKNARDFYDANVDIKFNNDAGNILNQQNDQVFGPNSYNFQMENNNSAIVDKLNRLKLTSVDLDQNIFLESSLSGLENYINNKQYNEITLVSWFNLMYFSILSYIEQLKQSNISSNNFKNMFALRHFQNSKVPYSNISKIIDYQSNILHYIKNPIEKRISNNFINIDKYITYGINKIENKYELYIYNQMTLDEFMQNFIIHNNQLTKGSFTGSLHQFQQGSVLFLTNKGYKYLFFFDIHGYLIAFYNINTRVYYVLSASSDFIMQDSLRLNEYSVLGMSQPFFIEIDILSRTVKLFVRSQGQIMTFNVNADSLSLSRENFKTGYLFLGRTLNFFGLMDLLFSYNGKSFSINTEGYLVMNGIKFMIYYGDTMELYRNNAVLEIINYDT